MAEIKFKGFVQAHEGNRPWEIAESHSVKEGDKWVTKSKTYHRVFLPREHPGLSEGDLVEVEGREITEEKKGDYPQRRLVYANTVTVVKPGRRSAAAVPQSAEKVDLWNSPINPDVPF